MLDTRLRPLKDRVLGPLARGPLRHVHPLALSLLALGCSVAAAIAAWRSLVVPAVGLWLIGRLLDGLDGLVARHRDRVTDVGGMLDLLFDTIGYAVIPLGLALGIDDRALWIATAVVIATFYVNAVSLGYAAALVEKRTVVAPGGVPRHTSVVLPRGLVEGTETIVAFTVALAVPRHAMWVWLVMAVAVAATAVERTVWAARGLRTRPDPPDRPAIRRPGRVWLRRGLVLGVWIAAALAWQWARAAEGLSATEAGQRLVDTADTAWWGTGAFVGVYLLRPLVLFPASLLTVAAGLLFGPVTGIAVVVVAANASALIAYGMGRLLRRDPQRGDVDPAARRLHGRWGDQLRTRSFETVFVLRLLFVPFDVVNVAAGALGIRVTPFLVATVLGSIPGTIAFVLLGASLERIDESVAGVEPWTVLAGIAIFVASLLVARAIRAGRFGERFAETGVPR